jgi:hypothetical protein
LEKQKAAAGNGGLLFVPATDRVTAAFFIREANQAIYAALRKNGCCYANTRIASGIWYTYFGSRTLT